MEFGKRLQELRTKAGLSQTAFAKKADISVDSLRNWEQDRALPKIDAAAKLAGALGVSVDELIGYIPALSTRSATERSRKRAK